MTRPAAELLALNGLLATALEMPRAERGAWLDALALPSDQVALRRVLADLLARAERTGGDEVPDFESAVMVLADESAELAGGDRVGPYTLLRQLGHGGMGAVWLAERSDGGLERQVALKLPLAGATPALRQRLLRERDILAGLAHPHIARLYDAGIDPDGQPWLALELVAGRPIDQFVRLHALHTRACIRLFLQVAQAVAYAHAHLVLHRDIKPANILVSDDGAAHLLDFGIAKMLEGETARDTALTQQAGLALTPDYASPEQILGERVTVASDVYALGVLLFELLVGARPYRLKRESRAALEEAIVCAQVPPPSTLAANRACRREIAGDLDAIVLKALRKAPAERYASVSALVDDLERHLAGRPVLARPDSAWYWAWRSMLGHRVAIGTGAAVLLSLLVGSVIALGEARTARLEARKAQAVQAFLTDVFLANTHDRPDPRRAQATTARELLTQGAKKIAASMDDAPEAKAEVLRTLGGLLREFGLDDDAVDLARRRVALLRGLYARDDPRLADGLLELAAAMEAASSFKERGPVLDEVQRIVDATRRPDPALQARLHLQRASVLQYHDWAASAREARAAEAQFASLHDDRSRMRALAVEGFALDQREDFAAAETCYAASIAIARSLPGGRPYELSHLLLQLASAEGDHMELAAADAHFREALAAAEQTFGPDHDEFVEVLVAYGAFLGTSARAAEALPHLRRAVEIYGRIKGANESFYLPKALVILGIVLVDFGRAEEGVPLLERAVELKRGPHPDLAVAAFMHLAARGEGDAGHLDRARALLDEAEQIIEGAGDRGVVMARANRVERARLALDARAPAEALDWLARAGVTAASPVATRQDLGTAAMTAEAEMGGGRFDDAARTVQLARSAIERLHLGTAAAREAARLDAVEGRILLARGDAQAATGLLRRALETRARVLDPSSPLLAESEVDLARARLQAGDAREARQRMQEARAVLAAHASLAPRYAQLL